MSPHPSDRPELSPTGQPLLPLPVRRRSALTSPVLKAPIVVYQREGMTSWEMEVRGDHVLSVRLPREFEAFLLPPPRPGTYSAYVRI